MNRHIRHWLQDKKISFVLHGIGLIFFLTIIFAAGNLAGTLLFPQREGRIMTPPYQEQSFRQSTPPTAGVTVQLSGLPKAPPPDASNAERGVFAQAIHSHAQEVNAIEIQGKCTLVPPIVRVREGASIAFKNQDTADHRLVIFMDETPVAAGSEKTIRAQFKNGPGVYGIACDQATGSGYLEISAN